MRDGPLVGNAQGHHEEVRSRLRQGVQESRKRKGPAKTVARKPRGRSYGYDTLKILISVWRLVCLRGGRTAAGAGLGRASGQQRNLGDAGGAEADALQQRTSAGGTELILVTAISSGSRPTHWSALSGQPALSGHKGKPPQQCWRGFDCLIPL